LDGVPSGRRKEYNIMETWFFRERALSALPLPRVLRTQGRESFVSVPSRVAAEKRILSILIILSIGARTHP
jgi:hypothetical protein